MRTKLIASVCTMFLACVSMSFAAKPSPEYVEAMTKRMSQLLESKQYTINVGSATPLKGGAFATQSRMILKGDKVFSGLPYIGGSQVTFNVEQSGYRFDCPFEDYQITPGKKSGSWKITFSAVNKSQIYKVRLSVFYNGTTTINISGGGLDPMNYQGVLVPTPKEGEGER